MWDIFISYASEDRPIAQELAKALDDQGIKVWYDETALNLGDSLRRSIDQGMTQSNYGVVILSPAFLAKQWTQYEMDGLVTREMAGGKKILPVWHKVTHEEVARYSPTLADKVAVSTDRGMPAVVREIMEVVRPGSGLSKVPFQQYTESSFVAQRQVPGVEDPSKLRDSLVTYFNEEELRSLCFDLGIDYDDLGGEGKSGKARDLVGYLNRRGRIPELTNLVRQLRPHVAW